MAAPHPLLLSVDLEEWFHARWATGYEKSRWRTPAAFFAEFYRSDGPRGDVVPAVEWLLECFAAEGVQTTFFILGEIAAWYPELVKKVAAAGHEIACHGLLHCDMSGYSRADFRRDLGQAKDRLEQLTGQPVTGFRAPNLVVQPWLADVLRESGFLYDSSVCPARAFRGKYADMSRCPQHPYRIGATVQEPGAGPLWELPLNSMPLLKIPAGTAIATRLFGLTWARFGLWWWRRTGPVHYYLHPYEIWTDRLPDDLRPWPRFMTRRRGPWMQDALRRILAAHRGRVLSCRDWLREAGG